MSRTPLEVICRSAGRPGFLRSVRAIVRSEAPGDPPLEPGSVVWISHWAFEGTGARHFPATPQANPDRLLWLSPKDLLPDWEVLHRQPFNEYWVLLRRPRRRHRRRHPEPYAFLSDPWHQVFGPDPFRFESLGELTHYLRPSALNPQKMKVR